MSHVKFEHTSKVDTSELDKIEKIKEYGKVKVPLKAKVAKALVKKKKGVIRDEITKHARF